MIHPDSDRKSAVTEGLPITADEHQAIIVRETNPERKAFYELCWHLGASQGDIANLKAEDIDWETNAISFSRKKTGVPVVIHLGEEALNILEDLPSEGLLFPNLQLMREAHRATEFKRCCRRVGVQGVTLHSYRYAWAERAKCCGYPERFAQETLGHNSKAVHRAYARRAQVVVPSLEEYEHRSANGKIIKLRSAPLKTTAPWVRGCVESRTNFEQTRRGI